MPFVKLDCGILNSTLWFEREAREVFITALLMAEPLELTEPMPQIAIGSLDFTGWSVPPGWYGFVPAAGIGILHQAQVKPDVGMPALTRLGEPEQTSRSKEFDGRRLVRVDGGFIVLNFMKYRDRDYTAAVRAARYRKRKFEKANQSKESHRDVTASHRNITQAEAEADIEEEYRGQKQKQIPGTKNKLDRKADQSDIAPAALVSADADFEAFRLAYPASRRVGGKLALRAWTNATKGRNGTHLAVMTTALEQHKRSEQWQTPKLIPLLTTWLNQERWNQTLPEPRRMGVTSKTAGNQAALQRFVDRHTDDPF